MGVFTKQFRVLQEHVKARRSGKRSLKASVAKWDRKMYIYTYVLKYLIRKWYEFVSVRYRSETRMCKSLGEIPTWALTGCGGLYLVVCTKLRFVIVCMDEHGVNVAGTFSGKSNLFHYHDSTMIPSRFWPEENLSRTI